MIDKRDLFTELASEEENWRFTAVDLLDAAEALEIKIEDYWRVEREHRQRREAAGKLLVFAYQPDPRKVHFMLMAYASENLCKGLLVSKDTTRAWTSALREGVLPSDMTGHDLTKLLDRVGFPMTPEDRELAFRLERASVWSARYPVPSKAEHKTLRFKTAKGDEAVPSWYREDDVAVVKEFVSRVESFVGDNLKEPRAEQDR